MSTNDLIQTVFVAAIVIGCVIWLIVRLLRRHRHGDCSCCGSTTCPLKDNKTNNTN